MTGNRLDHPATPLLWRDLALPDTEPLHIIPTNTPPSISEAVLA